MEDAEFDRLARAVGPTPSRRQVLRGLVAATLGATAWAGRRAGAAPICRDRGTHCGTDRQCCRGLVCAPSKPGPGREPKTCQARAGCLLCCPTDGDVRCSPLDAPGPIGDSSGLLCCPAADAYRCSPLAGPGPKRVRVRMAANGHADLASRSGGPWPRR